MLPLEPGYLRPILAWEKSWIAWSCQPPACRPRGRLGPTRHGLSTSVVHQESDRSICHLWVIALVGKDGLIFYLGPWGAPAVVRFVLLLVRGGVVSGPEVAPAQMDYPEQAGD
jgi:hypothetical protein